MVDNKKQVDFLNDPNKDKRSSLDNKCSDGNQMDILDLPFDQKLSKSYTSSSGLHLDQTETAYTRNKPRI